MSRAPTVLDVCFAIDNASHKRRWQLADQASGTVSGVEGQRRIASASHTKLVIEPLCAKREPRKADKADGFEAHPRIANAGQ